MQLVFFFVILLPGFVQYSWENSCALTGCPIHNPSCHSKANLTKCQIYFSISWFLHVIPGISTGLTNNV